MTPRAEEFPISRDALVWLLQGTNFKNRDVDTSGFQTNVYVKPPLPFVVKVLKGGAIEEDLTVKGYHTAMERLGGLVPPTSLVSDISLRYQGNRVHGKTAVVQEKEVPLNVRFAQLKEAENIEDVVLLAMGLAETSIQILQRGAYAYDNKIENHGCTATGDLVLLDLGTIVTDIDISVLTHDPYFHPETPIDRAVRLNKRGGVLYNTWTRLGELDAAAQREYASAMNLDFDPAAAWTFTDADVVEYSSAIAAKIRHNLGIPSQVVDYQTTLRLALRLGYTMVDFGNIAANMICRNKLDAQFTAIAKQELERHFVSNGTPVPAPQYVVG
ncbi:MAG: hypothetical protein Q7S65_00165 [Nanoarchaeota archaeon]|nr:hypothetical protein [Nanoarchaeota archaeon]